MQRLRFLTLLLILALSMAPSLIYAEDLRIYGRVPDFSIMTSEGDRLSAQDLRGTPWIAQFFFTSCSGPCPIVTGQLQALQTKLAQEALPIKFVSFSVDSKNDSIETLKHFKQRVANSAIPWHMLMPTNEELREIRARAFEPGNLDSPEAHSTSLILVDSQGQIRALYSGLEPQSQLSILKDLRGLTSTSTQQASERSLEQE